MWKTRHSALCVWTKISDGGQKTTRLESLDIEGLGKIPDQLFVATLGGAGAINRIGFTAEELVDGAHAKVELVGERYKALGAEFSAAWNKKRDQDTTKTRRKRTKTYCSRRRCRYEGPSAWLETSATWEQEEYRGRRGLWRRRSQLRV